MDKRTRSEVSKANAARLKANDPDHYRKLGQRSHQTGKPRKPGGFAVNRELARIAGQRGGKNKGINHRKRVKEAVKDATI